MCVFLRSSGLRSRALAAEKKLQNPQGEGGDHAGNVVDVVPLLLDPALLREVAERVDANLAPPAANASACAGFGDLQNGVGFRHLGERVECAFGRFDTAENRSSNGWWFL